MVQSNPVAENVFGTMGTVFWTGQLIPQVWKSWREKSTEGLSEWLMLLWGIASMFQGVYMIVQRINIPLMVQPQLFGFLAFVSWGQCQFYGRRRPRNHALFMTLALIAFSGILEFVLVIVIRPLKNQHTKNILLQFFGILASVIIAVALFPQYWEIYKLKAVIGISLIFMGIDMLGGVFFDLSLAFKEEFDIIAACQYSVVVVLDSVIVLAAWYFKIKAWRLRRKEAKLSEPDVEKDEQKASALCIPNVPQERLGYIYSSSVPCLPSQLQGKLEEGRLEPRDSKIPGVEVKEVDSRSI